MNMNKKLFVIVSAIALLLVAAFFLAGIQKRSQIPSSLEQKRTSQGAQAPNVSLKDYNGTTVNLSDFRGKALVINAWAAWCPFCRQELSDFSTVQKEFGDRITIIAIDRAETKEVAKSYTDALGVTDIVFLLDPSDSFYQSIGGFSMPETIFVDTNGVVVLHKRGPMHVQEMRDTIHQLLEK